MITAFRLLLCAAVGIAAHAAPACQGVQLSPGVEVQDVVSAHPAGSTYCLGPGVYRLTKTIVPKSGDTISGAPGTILNGARLTTEWTRKDSLWVATGQTQHSEPSWKADWPEIADPTSQYNEDVYLDDRPLKRVLSVAEVTPGKFFFDYEHASIYIADNPAGQRVECSAVEGGILTHSENVVIRGLIVEKFTLWGISAGTAALVENNEVRYVHGSGIRFGARAKIIRNNVHHNGKYGMNGSGESPLIEGNEIAYNNTAAYRTKKGGGCWDAGGTKFVRSNHLVVRGNYSHNNYCDGFWSDIDNINTTYEDNRIENNYRHGIFLEIGYAAVVRNNRIKGNMAAGIYLNSTSDQDIYGNTVEDNGIGTPDNGLPIPDGMRGGILMIQQNRGSGQYGERLSKNNRVHENTIRMTAGITGPTQKQGNATVFTQNNVFTRNHYFVSDPAGAWWSGPGGAKTWEQWLGSGQDKEATVERLGRK
jgi:parallel beta-helix repeat protein